MKSIIKGAGYILVHTPDMVIHNGTTQTTERVVNPESEYLKELPEHIRSFEDTLSYYPNQVYIGNVNSQIFHVSTCHSCPSEKNAVRFDSVWDAMAQGYHAHSCVE